MTKAERAMRRQVRSDLALQQVRRRCSSIFQNQVKRAAKWNRTAPEYTADDLMELVVAALKDPCRYCGRKLTGKNFEVDHPLPLSRGGQWWLSNTCIICRPCNRVKGSLTMDEFEKLLLFLNGFDKQARADVLQRLGIGGQWKR